MIISKLNGKALYCKGGGEGLKVKAAERNDEDESQHWIRYAFYIVSKKLKKVLFKTPGSHALFLTDFISTGNVDRVRFNIKNVSLHFN